MAPIPELSVIGTSDRLTARFLAPFSTTSLTFSRKPCSASPIFRGPFKSRIVATSVLRTLMVMVTLVGQGPGLSPPSLLAAFLGRKVIYLSHSTRKIKGDASDVRAPKSPGQHHKWRRTLWMETARLAA